MTEPEEPANLPAIVTGQGGALVSVLQWPQYLVALDRTEQTQIAILVKGFPDLNTEAGVDMLADAMRFYGVKFDRWFAELLEQYGIETITLGLEILREYAVVGGVDDDIDPEADEPQASSTNLDDREQLELERALELVGWVRDLGHPVDTSEQGGRVLERLGGWPTARLLEHDHVEAVFAGEMDTYELRKLVNSPHENLDGGGSHEGEEG